MPLGVAAGQEAPPTHRSPSTAEENVTETPTPRDPGDPGARPTTALAAHPEPLLVVEPGLTIRFANLAAEHLFGCPPGALTGRRLDQLVPATSEIGLDVAAAERRRIGQELHDDVGQELVGLGMMAAALVEELRAHGGAGGELAVKVRDRVQHVIGRVRAATRELTAPDIGPAELPAALESLAARVRESAGIACTFEGPSDAEIQDGPAAVHLYRIAQEAVANALRHAAPTSITITLGTVAGQTELRVRDDGRGFDPSAPPGLGLKTMRDRAALIGATLLLDAGNPGTLIRCVFE
jgi:signal transduction histidine kinase